MQVASSIDDITAVILGARFHQGAPGSPDRAARARRQQPSHRRICGYRKHVYEFDDVDLILLEGIFLFKRELQQCYDFRLWIDCSFKTALERALSRSQEGLPPADTIDAYERIYFPAERVHFERDSPRDSADLVFVNDEHLE